KYIKNSDVILGLGTRFSQPSTNNYTLLGDNTKLIHVDVSPNTIGKVYNPFLPIVSDAKEFSKVLLDIISPKENSRRSEKVINLKKEYINFSVLKRNYSEEYVDMDGMMYDLNGLLPTDTIITNDAGNFFTWLSRYYQFNHNDNYIGPTSGAMGYGIPAAIGAKISQPNRTVVSFSGDGGAMMTIQEFDTAVRYNIPIISIVINNSILGTIRAHQEREFPDRVVGTSFSDINIAKIAENMGGYGERIKSNEHVIPAVKRAINSSKPSIIEVLTDAKKLSANSNVE